MLDDPECLTYSVPCRSPHFAHENMPLSLNAKSPYAGHMEAVDAEIV